MKLADVRAGTSWSGDGYQAFADTVDRAPTPGDITNAQDTLRKAAAVCETLADGIEDCQERIAWCRDRIDSLCLAPDGDLTDEQQPLVQAIADDVAAAREHYRNHLHTAQESFAALESATIFAGPPPGFWDRAGNLVSWGGGQTRQAWNGLFDEGAIFDRIDDLHNPGQLAQLYYTEQSGFWIGLWEGQQQMYRGAIDLAVLANPSWTPAKIDMLYNLALTYQAARDDPRQFEWDTAMAIIGYDTFRQSPGQWAGELAPAAATAAIPFAGPAIAASTRAAAIIARITRLATHLRDAQALRMAHRALAEDVVHVPEEWSHLNPPPAIRFDIGSPSRRSDAIDDYPFDPENPNKTLYTAFGLQDPRRIRDLIGQTMGRTWPYPFIPVDTHEEIEAFMRRLGPYSRASIDFFDQRGRVQVMRVYNVNGTIYYGELPFGDYSLPKPPPLLLPDDHVNLTPIPDD